MYVLRFLGHNLLLIRCYFDMHIAALTKFLSRSALSILRRIHFNCQCTIMRASLYSTSSVNLHIDSLDTLSSTSVNKLDLQIACKNAIAEFTHFGDRLFRLEEPQKDTLWELHALHVQAMGTRSELLKVIKAGLQSERQALAVAIQENDGQAERKVRNLY